MNKMIVGEKYILKLKHTPFSKFSARSTGYLNSKDLPFKSSENKNNKTLYQNTPTRWGEMEMSNLLCSDDPDTLRDMTMVYSTSTIARRDTSQLYEGDILDMDEIKIDPDATNRVAEMFHVYLKNLGYKMHFRKKRRE